jgi:hypothetical protein
MILAKFWTFTLVATFGVITGFNSANAAGVSVEEGVRIATEVAGGAAGLYSEESTAALARALFGDVSVESTIDQPRLPSVVDSIDDLIDS